MVKKIDWATKVQLCEQGRATENFVLQSYRAIFIALETILFTAVLTILWPSPLAVIIVVAFLSLPLTVLWWHVCDLRGDAVDRWEAALYILWQETPDQELTNMNLAKHYESALKRRELRLEGKRGNERIGGQIAILKGGGRWNRFISARWIFNIFIPFLVALIWIIIIIIRVIFFRY